MCAWSKRMKKMTIISCLCKSHCLYPSLTFPSRVDMFLLLLLLLLLFVPSIAVDFIEAFKSPRAPADSMRASVSCAAGPCA